MQMVYEGAQRGRNEYFGTRRAFLYDQSALGLALHCTSSTVQCVCGVIPVRYFAD